MATSALSPTVRIRKYTQPTLRDILDLEQHPVSRKKENEKMRAFLSQRIATEIKRESIAELTEFFKLLLSHRSKRKNLDLLVPEIRNIVRSTIDSEEVYKKLFNDIYRSEKPNNILWERAFSTRVREILLLDSCLKSNHCSGFSLLGNKQFNNTFEKILDNINEIYAPKKRWYQSKRHTERKSNASKHSVISLLKATDFEQPGRSAPSLKRVGSKHSIPLLVMEPQSSREGEPSPTNSRKTFSETPESDSTESESDCGDI